MGLPLVEINEYKAYANIINPNQDAKIASIIPKVSQLVKTICRRSFIDYVSTAKVEYHNGGFSNILTEEYPVLSVESLEVSDDYGVTYTPVTNYAIDSAKDNIVCTTGEFLAGTNKYKLTYKCGYSALPDDLKLAVFDLITYYLKNDQSVHSNKAPGTNAVQIEYITTTALPSHIKRVLDLYVADYL